MKKIKRIIAIALSLVMLLSCVACGKTESKGEKQVVENVYKLIKHDLPEGMDYVSSMLKTSDGYLFYGDMTDEERGYYTAIVKTDKNYRTVAEYEATIEMEEDGDTYLSSISISPDGTFWSTVSWNFYDEATNYWENKYYLTHLDSNFNVIEKKDTKEIVTVEQTDYSYGIYLGYLTIDDNGNIFAIADDKLVCIDGNTMELIYEKKAADINASWFNAIMKTSKGLVVSFYDNDSDFKGAVLDTATGNFSEPFDFDDSGYGQYYDGSGEYDFYTNSGEAIYGHKIETGEKEEIMNFLNSDLMSFYPSSLISLDGDAFLSTMWDEESEDGGMIIAELVPVPDSEVTPKYIITLGGLYIDYETTREVYKFNRESEEYRIVIKEYAANIDYSENSEYTYEDAIAKLNGDIAAGNGPDIIVCNEQLPFDSYASKGLFADLYKFMEQSAITKPELFEQNVLKAYEIGGKLYRIAPSFSVVTLAAKPEMLGEAYNNWNMESFMNLANSLPEDVTMFQDISRDEMLAMFVRYMYDDFVDSSTGMCSFDDGRFEMILEFVNKLSTKSFWEDINYEELPADFWEQRDNAFANNKVVLSTATLGGFYDITYLVNYTYKTLDFDFVGFPTESGSAAINENSQALAISSKSDFKDGAWEFISRLLSEEYQDEIGYNFPVRTSSLMKAMEEALKSAEEEKKMYEDNKNNDGGIDDGFGVVMPRMLVATAETEEIIVEESTNAAIDIIEEEAVETEYYFLDEALANKVLNCIRGADILVRTNTDVTTIINEEATRFFDGQCTAKQAAAEIQSRVFIYISENS